MPTSDPASRADRAVAVIGAGHVGLVTAVGFAEHGIRVRAADADPARVEMLREGRAPFHEPGLDDLLARTIASGLLTFHESNTEAAEGASVVFLAVPTPASADGSADLGIVEKVIHSIASVVAPPAVLAVKSSVPPGSWRQIAAWMEDAGCTAPLVVNPEFLQEGKAVETVLHPTRVVVGSTDPEAAAVVADLHEPFGAPVVRTDPASAELIKYAANSYLAMRVTFANTIANLSDAVGADIGDVVAGLGLDPRIGDHYLKPGPGYGGSCFPKDVPALIAVGNDAGIDLGLMEAVIAVNAAQTARVVEKIAGGLGSLSGKRIGLLGLAFKADTDDVVESPAVRLAGALVDRGAEVSAYDPAARPDIDGVGLAGSALEALAGADAMVIATEWPEFAGLDLGAVADAMAGTLVVDARNLLEPDVAAAAGLDYRGMGR